MPNEAEPKGTWLESIKSRLHVFAYISASIFLQAEAKNLILTQGNNFTNSFMNVLGWIFLIPVLFLLLSLLPSARLTKWSHYSDRFSTMSLYLVVIAIFIKESVEWVDLIHNPTPLLIIPLVLLAFLAKDFVSIIKHFFLIAAKVGKRDAFARELKILAFLLTYFALLLIAFNVTAAGNPIFWLMPSVALLLLALILDKTLV